MQRTLQHPRLAPIFSRRRHAIVRCQECSCKLSIAELLLGFEERDMTVQLHEIKEQLTGMDSRIANYFMATMRAIADEAKDGPRLFTLRSREAGFSLKQLFTRPMELQLWCEAEGCQHPVIDQAKAFTPSINRMNGSNKLRRMQTPF